MPGYSQDVYFFGKHRMISPHAWFKNVLNQTIFVSYKDTIYFNFTTTKTVFKQPERFIEVHKEILEEW